MSDTKPKKLWFRRKRYGYGWTPSSWQGWLIVLVYVAIVVSGAFVLQNSGNVQALTPFFVIAAIILTAILIAISFIKGERPGWRWGNEDDTYEG